MIRLKSLLTEDLAQYFPNGKFDWNAFSQIPDNQYLEAVKELFTSEYRDTLTPDEVFHIVLSCPSKDEIVAMYKLAQQCLTPDQLSQLGGQTRFM